MRLWLVPFEQLSDQHLLGQHKEIHMLLGCLDRPRFRNHPQVKFYSDKRKWLCTYHDLVVEEMKYRFSTIHKSPIPDYSEGDFLPPDDWVDYDIKDLAFRYQSRPEFYRWTKRRKPCWVASEIKGKIPLYNYIHTEGHL